MRSPFLAALAALSLTGCAVGVAAPPAPDAAVTPLGASPAAAAGSLSGLVAAPAIISTGGGNIIATGGLNYGLLAVSEQPLADTEVYLADQAGQPLLGVAAVRTDGAGRYAFQNLPPNQTFVVAARVRTAAGKPATFQTLARTTAEGTDAPISAASTMVASAVVKKEGALAKFQPEAYRAAVDATARHLTDADLPDFSDPAAIAAKMEALAAAIAEVKTRMAAVEEQLAEVKAELAEIKDQLEAGKKAEAPKPSPSPSQVEKEEEEAAPAPTDTSDNTDSEPPAETPDESDSSDSSGSEDDGLGVDIGIGGVGIKL